MPEPIPNCLITVHFYAGTPPSFSYNLSRGSMGWMVQADGSIYPPARGRVLQFSLNGFPNPDVQFGGFQISDTGDFTEAPDWTSLAQLEALGIQVITPDALPIGTGTTPGPLTFDLSGFPPELPGPSDPTPRLFYNVAVVVGSDATRHWDDPKIYDDGSI